MLLPSPTNLYLSMFFPGKGKPKSVGESHLPLSPDPYPFRLSRQVHAKTTKTGIQRENTNVRIKRKRKIHVIKLI